MLKEAYSARPNPCVPSPTNPCIIDEVVVSRDVQFLNFVARYGKNYKTSDEFQSRRAKWLKTDGWITSFQGKNASFAVGHNKFSDWSEEEKKSVLGTVMPWGRSSGD